MQKNNAEECESSSIGPSAKQNNMRHVGLLKRSFPGPALSKAAVSACLLALAPRYDARATILRSTMLLVQLSSLFY